MNSPVSLIEYLCFSWYIIIIDDFNGTALDWNRCTGTNPFLTSVFYSFPSTIYETLMMCGNTAPSIGPFLTAFVLILNHHCFDTEITVPVVSFFMARTFLPDQLQFIDVPTNGKLSVQMGLVTEIISDAFKSTLLRNFFIFLIAKKCHHVALSMLGIRQRRLQ